MIVGAIPSAIVAAATGGCGRGCRGAMVGFGGAARLLLREVCWLVRLGDLVSRVRPRQHQRFGANLGILLIVEHSDGCCI